MTATATKTCLYLSRLVLDPTRFRVQAALVNTWDLHRALCSVPGVGHTDQGRCLFRVDSRPGRKPEVLVQTPLEVDWAPLVAEKFAESYLTKRLVPESLPPGAALLFRTLCVPRECRARSGLVPERERSAAIREIARVSPASAPPSLRIWREHDADWNTIGWVIERAGGARETVGRRAKKRQGAPRDAQSWLQRALRGTEVLSMDLAQRPAVVTRITLAGGRERIQAHGYLVQGALRVTDPQVFSEVVARGVGPMRAFGYGLVSLAPARSS